jgi:UDP-N-acetylglucosamine 2-epimerase (non-hydrolysing)
MKQIKVVIAVGARPNFMKSAPLLNEFEKYPVFKPFLVHTGQHYDRSMSASFFEELNLPEPDIYLGVGSGTHAEQTGKIMLRVEKVLLEAKPDLVVVVGDVNSTVACALVASKLGIPVAHVEAGLRSFDRSMPEEINRLLTDQISDLLFTTCEDANQNLRREGIPESRIFFVGNVMIDSLMSHMEVAKKSSVLQKLSLRKGDSLREYVALTMHRPSNVDNRIVLRGILNVLLDFSRKIPVIFPTHPRTLKRMREFKLNKMVRYTRSLSSVHLNNPDHNMIVIPPLGYLDFLSLMSQAALVLTDSGGIQEETTILGIPCLTLRNNTERPITVKEGTNKVIGNDPKIIKKAIREALEGRVLQRKRPKLWDGKAAARIVKVLQKEFN